MSTELPLLGYRTYRVVIRVESVYGKSRVTQDFTMYAHLNHVEVNVTVDWHEQFKLQKLRFPITVHAKMTTDEIPYGYMEREKAAFTKSMTYYFTR